MVFSKLMLNDKFLAAKISLTFKLQFSKQGFEPVGGHLDQVGLELGREAEAALGEQARVRKVVREIFRHAVSRHEPEHGFESPPEVVVLDHGLEDLVDPGRLVPRGQVPDVPTQQRDELRLRQNRLDLVHHLRVEKDFLLLPKQRSYICNR